MVGSKKRKGNKAVVNIVLGIICFIWLIPTLGLFISSFRPAADILQTGWWKVFPHQEWKASNDVIRLSKDVDLRGPIEVNGKTYTDAQLKAGVVEGGKRLMWENRRARMISVQTEGWVTKPNLTTENYKNVLSGKEYKLKKPTAARRCRREAVSPRRS